MQGRVKWLDNMSFVGESGSGHSIVMDGAPEIGGRNLGMRPMEMLLLGAGACSAFDIVSILKKSRQRVMDCEVQLTSERAENIPKVFTHINMHFIVTGEGLSADRVAKAVSLSADKYCSASIMLGKTATITHTHEIREASAASG